MVTKTKGTAPQTTNQTGFEVRSPCGRAWFVPRANVREDYVVFLMREDHIDRKTAEHQVDSDPDCVETWFAEQFNWSDVERYGTLIKAASEEEVLRALNSYRNNESAGPADDYTAQGVA